MGENLTASPTQISGGGSCSGINFGVMGTAVGPYPGTFFESGSIPVDSNNVGHFQANFQITAGPLAIITGSKTGQARIGCGDIALPGGAPGQQFVGDFVTNFTAAINSTPFGAGSCSVTGTGNVSLTFILDANGGIVTGSSFSQEFITSTTCQPAVGPPAAVLLTPATAMNPVGTQHTVTATVTDATSHAVSDTTVFFTVSGADTTQGTCTTDSNGQCSFTYTGPQLPGADDITGCTGGYNAPPCGNATKVWMLPASTPGQVTGGGQILMPPSDRVTFGFNAQSDGTTTTGNCNVIDHEKGIHIKCTDVTNVVVVGQHATFFGTAEQNGTSTDFRIDVDDLATPGNGLDTFKVQTGAGYVAGGTLTSGNIVIHH